MPSNTAAYLIKPQTSPLEIRSAPYASPKEGQILIKNGAVAINPIDWILQDTTPGLNFGWLKYPFILGSDVAGEVVEVGKGVTRFKVGDRVLGHATGEDKTRNDQAEKGFQTYTLLLDNVAAPIPSNVSYEQASVVPLGCSTAACGLFEKDQLGLQYPTVPAPTSTGKAVLIWGGSTSVGCNAIQLAAAAGYEVITTCSPKNFPLVKKLGAAEAYDYKSKTTVRDLLATLKNRTLAGAMTVGRGGPEACVEILAKSKGSKMLTMANYPMPEVRPKRFELPRTIYHFGSWMVGHKISCLRNGVRSNFIFGSSLIHNEIGKKVYEEFLPQALAQGLYVCAPEVVVAGHGLESIPAAMDMQRKGVSAKKVVVTL